jgi:hypothetical protein
VPAVFDEHQQGVESLRCKRNVLLVAKEESLRRVESEGAKFVQMFDLFAHKLPWILSHNPGLEASKTLPKLSQDFGKTFYGYWGHKVTN